VSLVDSFQAFPPGAEAFLASWEEIETGEGAA